MWEDVVGKGIGRRRDFGSVGKKRERTQRNKHKHIERVRDSKKHGKAKMQRETDLKAKTEAESVRNSEKGLKTETHRGVQRDRDPQGNNRKHTFST